MQFSISSVALLPFLSLASAACYESGAPWPSDHAATLAAIQAASYQMELSSPLAPGEHEYNTQVGDKCIHFVLDNISGSSKSITTSDATDGFSKEYRGCAHGGDTTYTNWRYVMDPNEEGC